MVQRRNGVFYSTLIKVSFDAITWTSMRFLADVLRNAVILEKMHSTISIIVIYIQ